MEKSSKILTGLVLAIGVAGAGFLVKEGLENFRRPRGQVTVKGVVEVPAKADLAIWKINFFSSGINFAEAMAKAQDSKKKVEQFLQDEGFSEEIQSVIPSNSVQFQDNKTIYEVSMGFVITTKDVDRLEQTYSKIGTLINEGVTFKWSHPPIFQFTKFIEERPKIFSLAVKNAQEMADKFAKDAKVKLGRIIHADQGTFQILGQDGTSSYEARSSKDKKIRVVSRFTYTIE